MKVIFVVMDTEIKAFFGHWQKQEKNQMRQCPVVHELSS